jgi:hypothetical protein
MEDGRAASHTAAVIQGLDTQGGTRPRAAWTRLPWATYMSSLRDFDSAAAPDILLRSKPNQKAQATKTRAIGLQCMYHTKGVTSGIMHFTNASQLGGCHFRSRIIIRQAAKKTIKPNINQYKTSILGPPSASILFFPLGVLLGLGWLDKHCSLQLSIRRKLLVSVVLFGAFLWLWLLSFSRRVLF